MFTIEMIILSITSNLGLIAFVAILTVTAVIALKGEAWLEAAIDKNPEWWLEERDMSIIAIIRRNRKA